MMIFIVSLIKISSLITNNSNKVANINKQNVRSNKDNILSIVFLCLIQNKYKFKKKSFNV